MHASILLVDDNKEFVDNIKDVLEDEECEVLTAHSGEEACLIAGQRSFDLVLMDIKMPGMNGVECFLRLKDKDPDLKVVLVTAYALDELIQQAHDNGVLAVLKKPLDLAQLLGIIHETRSGADGGCVLIADDDRNLCDNLNDALAEHGYRVAMANDGPSAIQAAQNQRFDILLLDLKFQELNGLEIFRRIKALQPKVITILITGYAEEMKEVIRQAIEENAYTMLPKPIDMDRLLKLMNTAAENRKTGDFQKP
ncbi:MAG: response regulator [Desulfobacteraceae bacterium]|nr:response regulator [Desulfobacteraceae bacterium]